MILSGKDLRDLAKLENDLPAYCEVRQRKGYAVVYFVVRKHIRPKGWKPTYEIGRTDRLSNGEIIKRGRELYEALKEARKSELCDSPSRVPKGSLAWLIERYKESEHYTNLKPATQKGYLHYLDTIKEWSALSGHPHVRLLTPPTIWKFLNRWKDTPRTRKHYKANLSKLYQVAIEQGCVSSNPMREIKLPKAKSKKQPFKVWKLKDIESFANKADELGLSNVGTAVIVAWEAFRQTDVFDLQEPRDYKNGSFRFFTSKTDQLITIKASARTVERLSNRPSGQLLLTVNDLTKMKWTKDSFYNQYKKVLEQCGLKGHVFRRIRNSSAIHALKADLTDAEFQQRYGWTKSDVRAMRDLYTDIDQEIIDKGAEKIARLEKVQRIKK